MELLKIISNKAFYNQFEDIARNLFSEYELVAGNKIYELCELEFYYNSSDHDDPYIHGDEMQKTNSQWYFHGSGIDITLGCSENNSYGGILIRGIKDIENFSKFISGPLLVAKELFYQHGGIELSSIPFGLKRKDMPRNLDNDFVATTRINLPNRNEIVFREKAYRFVTHICSKHAFKEKGKVAQVFKTMYPNFDLIEKFGYKIL